MKAAHVYLGGPYAGQLAWQTRTTFHFRVGRWSGYYYGYQWYSVAEPSPAGSS